MKQKWDKTKPIILLIFFILLEYFSDKYIQTLGPYASYFLETLFILISLFLMTNFLRPNIKPNKRIIIYLLLSLIFGFVIRALAQPLLISIPFDQTNKETIFFLLLVGPLLEELLFRGTLIECCKSFTRSSTSITLISGFMFSLAHLRVINEVQPEIKTFIEYQAAYTLILGVACSQVRQTMGIAWSISTHFIFNLGFFIAGSLV